MVAKKIFGRELYDLCNSKNFGDAENLIKTHGKDLDINYIDCNSGYSILIVYVQSSRHNIVYKLIELGVDVNYQDGFRATALYYACYNQDKDMIEMLIKAGTNTNLRDSRSRVPRDMLGPSLCDFYDNLLNPVMVKSANKF